MEPQTEESKKVDSYRIVDIKSRQLSEDLKPVVIAPFLNSLRYGNDFFKIIDQDAFYSSYKKYIEHLLNREHIVIRFAMLPDDTVIGWSMIEDKTLHYIWVKKEARRKGVGMAITPDFNVITHITNIGLNIWVSKYPDVIFNPFA